MFFTSKRFRLADSDPGSRSSPLIWLRVSAVVIIASVAVVTALSIDRFRDATISSGSQRLENAVLLLVRHFDRQLKDFAILQSNVVAELQALNISSTEVFRGEVGTLSVHELLRGKIGGWSDVAGFNVFDNEGRLINSSRNWPVADVSIADRPYFRALAADPDLETEVAILKSRFSDENAIVFARKVTGSNGGFLGVVTRAIRPSTIDSFFASAGLGEDASIAMHHQTGTLLARYPAVDGMLGRNFKDGSEKQRAVFERSSFTARLDSPMDGKDRLLASRAIPSEPFVIVATDTMDSVLASWRSQTKFFLGAAAVAICMICSLLYLVFKQINRQLSREKKWLQTAVDNMNQGLLLFDRSERLIVCNKRYLEMYGLSDSVIRPGCSLHRLVQHRADTGSLGSDVETYYKSVISGTGTSNNRVAKTADGRLIKIANEPVDGGGWLATHEDVTQRLCDEERVTHLAYHDQLTGLPNRALFRAQVEQRLADPAFGTSPTILYIDVDKFKDVNDSLGHHVGDELLKTIAERLRSCVGPNDLVARLGGDEFAVVMHATDKETALQLASVLQETIRQPSLCFGHRIFADSSAGLAIGCDLGLNLDQILKNADLAMYAAKTNGRRTCVVFTPELEECANARHQIEFQLRKGLSDGRFDIHYQPIVDLTRDCVTGFEALLRFQSETGMPLSPAQFIPIAEETGLIIEIGDWVLKQACLTASQWPDDFTVAVNVSPIQFRSTAFTLNVLTALARSGLSPRRLELEITEAVLIRDDERALAVLHELKAIGVRIALDDFGTGYSSLGYLRRFPFDKIKIDRSFIADLDVVEGSSSIIKAIVSMASAHKISTTAEGVETLRQRDLVRGFGCDQMQGYLFSPALPANALGAFLYANAASAA